MRHSFFWPAFLLALIMCAPVFAEEPLQEITVKQGDTLWGISRVYLQDPSRWPEILKYNQLPLNDPAVALPGMKLKVPVKLIKENLRKADLIFLLNEVLYRRKSEPNWRSAFKDLDLYNEDGLRTLEKSEAHVKFYSGDMLKVAKNSLVVLRPELKKEEINLIAGVVRAGTTKVITPTAEVNPRTPDTIYKARVRGDRATIVHVERGSTEVMGLATGKKVIVEQGYANITQEDKAPTIPTKVPALPDFETPDFDANGKLIPIPADRYVKEPKAATPPAETAKKPQTRPVMADRTTEAPKPKRPRRILNSYVLQVSPTRNFAKVLIEINNPMKPDTDVNDIRGLNLPDGHYYRRVLYVDQKGVESAFSVLPDFSIDTTPPSLEVLYPPDGLRTRDNLLKLEGKTDRGGVIVTVNRLPVEVRPDGSFNWSVVLSKPGENKIRIVAKDLAGNEAVQERTVNFRGK